MPWGFAAAGVASAVAGAVTSSQAAGAEAAAGQQANAFLGQQYNTDQAYLAPYGQAGANSLAALMAGLGIGSGGTQNPNASLVAPFTTAQYQQSPGYGFQMQQGLNAVTNSASATGGVNSGNTLKALMGYGQGLANQDYQQAYSNYTNRQQQLYSMLAGQAQQGAQVAGNQAQLGQNYGNSVSGNLIGIGNANAAGIQGVGNAIQSGIQSIGGAYSGLYGAGSGTNVSGAVNQDYNYIAANNAAFNPGAVPIQQGTLSPPSY